MSLPFKPCMNRGKRCPTARVMGITSHCMGRIATNSNLTCSATLGAVTKMNEV
jgi:hypothetical protein